MWKFTIFAWPSAKAPRTVATAIAARTSSSPTWSAFLRILSVAALLIAGLAACSGPCQELANKICSCKPNQTEQNQCQTLVENSTREPSDLDNQRCEGLLDSCTCDALDQNNLAACGLAKSEGTNQ